MYNHLMTKEQLNVKAGDHVVVMGYRGIVEDVYRGYKTEYNGREYVKKAGTDYTSVKVDFKGELSTWGQYNHGYYGNFTIIDNVKKWETYL